MFGNKDYITKTQLNEALTPLLKRIRDLETQLKALNAGNYALNEKVSKLEALIEDKKEMPPTSANADSEPLPLPHGGGVRGEGDTLPSGDGRGGVVPEEGRGGVSGLLYLPSPTPSGAFTEWSSEEEIGKSIYLLQTDDGEHGTFSLLQSSDAMATAMISVSQFLKPVCRIIGNTHRMPDHIETEEKGEAQKKDGIWTVTKKTVVKFV